MTDIALPALSHGDIIDHGDIGDGRKFLVVEVDPNLPPTCYAPLADAMRDHHFAKRDEHMADLSDAVQTAEASLEQAEASEQAFWTALASAMAGNA